MKMANTIIGQVGNMESLFEYVSAFEMPDTRDVWVGVKRPVSKYFLFYSKLECEKVEYFKKSLDQVMPKLMMQLEEMENCYCGDEIFELVDKIVDHPESGLPQDFKKFPPVIVHDPEDDVKNVLSALNILVQNFSMGGINFDNGKTSEGITNMDHLVKLHQIIWDECWKLTVSKMNREILN